MKFDDRRPGKDSWRWKLLIAAALLSAFAHRPDAAQLPGGIERLGWLQGCWAVTTGEREVDLVFEAHPSNQPMALFYSIDVGPSRIVFENPKHDFPQRIGYARKGNTLLAWIEGTQDGKVRRLEFSYLRASCNPG